MRDLLVEAINNLCPNSEYVFTESDYSTIVWHKLEGTAPTKTAIEKEIKRIQENAATAKAKAEADKAALLARLGLTEDELKTILG